MTGDEASKAMKRQDLSRTIPIRKRRAGNPRDMGRIASRTAQHLVDLAVLSTAFALAFVLRFDGDPPVQMLKRWAFLWPYVTLVSFMGLWAVGVPRFAWRYVGLREASRIFGALFGVSVLFLVLRFVSEAAIPAFPHAQYALIPIGVIVIHFVLSFLGISGVRILRRLAHERRTTKGRPSGEEAQLTTLLIGAGRAGVAVAKEMKSRPDLGLKAVGFLDDDLKKLGTEIHGLRVLGGSKDLEKICRKLGVQQVVITIAAAGGGIIRDLVNLCEAAGVQAKIIPGIWAILDGQVNLSRIREVSIEDLLGREAVHLETDLMHAWIGDKTVMVTGAGGSIGSELCRQIALMGPKKIILVERAEPALFAIGREMTRTFPQLIAEAVLCDVQDEARVLEIFDRERPHIVFHAAAHKHVPLMEANPGEAIKNNVFGTVNVAQAANRFEAESFVFVSTDKAVNPTSIMGTTKRVAEIYIRALSKASQTKYVAVRFGNVLGSTGSVIPIFKEQIKRGGPVTVTHPEMKRYFMTIPEASQLVMQAGAMGEGGEIYVLDMGEPVRIVDLAHDLIRLSGFEPEEDIAVEFIGKRPGEKLFEELAFDQEKMAKTRHPKIYIGQLVPQHLASVNQHLKHLAALTGETDRDRVSRGLKKLVPEMIDPRHALRTKTGEIGVMPNLQVADAGATG